METLLEKHRPLWQGGAYFMFSLDIFSKPAFFNDCELVN
jgi:hypothetical protein